MNIYKEQQLDNAFRDGLNTVRDFVCTTLGRNGYNVALAGKIEGEMLNTDVIRITKDGITALDHLRQHHTDQVVRQAANLIWSAVYKQWGAVGDGTTTTTFLTVGAYNLLLDYQIANPTLSAWQIAKDFRTLVDAILAEIEKLTRKIETKEQLRKLALISANGEEDIAELVSEAVWNSGVYGKITKERTSGAKSIIEARDGYVWDKGVCESKSLLGYGKREEMNPYIFVLDDIFDKQEKFTTIVNAYEKLCKENGNAFVPLIIICHSCEGEALHYIRALADKKAPHIIIPIVAPKEAVFRTQMLQDIALVCNTQVYSPTSQWYDKKLNFLGKFGKAYRIETGYKETEIEYFKDHKPEQSYLDAIQSQADNDTFTDADREHFRERLARLTKGSCIIRVGSETSTSQDAKYDLFDDAIGASQSALRNGYVIGGGLTYLEAIWSVEKSQISTPMFQLFTQLAEKIGSIGRLQTYQLDNKGLKVGTDEIIDYDKEGIYDPSQGVSNALNVAASIATSLITTQNGHL